MKNKTWIIVIAVGLGLSNCTFENNKGGNTTSPISEIRKIPVTNLIEKDITLHHEYIADIQAFQNVEIRARVKGYLEKVYVDEGQKVKKGQLLFRINDEEYEAKLAKAKANLETAIAEAKGNELEVNRVKILVEKKVISDTELEVAEAQLKAAHAKVSEARSAYSNARIELSHSHITAPFNGIVNRIPLKIGSLISEGTLLTSVSNNSTIFAYFNVSESEYLEYIKIRMKSNDKSHDQVDLILADGTKYNQKGRIETMQGEFQPGTGSIAFRAHFPNPDGILKHGSTGKIRLTNKIHNALLLPQKAAIAIQDKNFVFIMDSTHKVTMKSFVPKNRFSYFYVISEGLKPGETIVYEGLQDLREGSLIDPVIVSMDSLIKNAPKIGAFIQ